MARVTIVGDIAEDILFSVAEGLDPGALGGLTEVGCLQAHRVARQLGGSGANIALFLSRFEVDVSLLAVVSSRLGYAVDRLQAAGVDTSHIVEADLDPSLFVSLTDPAHIQLSTFYSRKPVPSLIESSCRSYFQSHGTPSILFIAPLDPSEACTTMSLCPRENATIVFDPGQQIRKFSPEQLRLLFGRTDMVFLNQHEATWTERQLGRSFRSEYPDVLFITTLGANGCQLSGGGRWGAFQLQVGAPHVTSDWWDPTGMGDAFRAGFLTTYLNGDSLEACARFACATAVVMAETRSVGAVGQSSIAHDRVLRRVSAEYSS